MKDILFGKNLEELQELCDQLAWPKFRAKQLYRGLYQRDCCDFSAFTSLSKTERHYLQQNYELSCYPVLKLQKASDGTIKFLYPLREYFSREYFSKVATPQVSTTLVATSGAAAPLPAVETVLIPRPQNALEYTLCLSSQWGCRWACQFCQTGELGLKRQLSTAEILAQLRCARQLLKKEANITRLVFMGMGEPLENPNLEKTLAIMSDANGGYGFGARRITVSTVGLVQYLKIFLDFDKAYRLAVSVHNPIGEERSRLIPAEFSSPLEAVLQLLEQQQKMGDKRRLTFEYTLVTDENDQNYHAVALAKLALRVRARVNLIACHQNNAGYLGADGNSLRRFQSWLEQQQVRCTIRKSQGEEIQAACGMLAGESNI